MKLYRPVGQTELDLIIAADYQAFPPRLPEQPIFYPVLNEKYAREIAERWNKKSADSGFAGYSATLNENAVVGLPGNPNSSKLSYGNKGDESHTPSDTTPPSQTVTYTWKMDVFKYTKDGETEKALADAKFTLSKSADGSNPLALVSEGNNVYRVAKTGETGTVTEITTDATGKFTIKGLDGDTYYLTEIQAPAGYNKLKSAVTVTISSADGTVTYTYDGQNATGEVKVLNNTGTELPSTGGIGTTIFYVLGGVLVVGAAVLLVTKKRMER